jgi:hypothetical protein
MTAVALGIFILIVLTIAWGAVSRHMRRGFSHLDNQLAAQTVVASQDRQLAQQQHKELTTSVDAILADLRSIRRAA